MVAFSQILSIVKERRWRGVYFRIQGGWDVRRVDVSVPSFFGWLFTVSKQECCGSWFTLYLVWFGWYTLWLEETFWIGMTYSWGRSRRKLRRSLMLILDLMKGKKHKSRWRYWISKSSYFTVFFVHVFGLGYGACMLYIVVHFRFHWLVEM